MFIFCFQPEYDENKMHIDAMSNLADNLIKLSISDEKNSLYYLVQSFYISTKYYVNPKDVLYVVTEIIRIIGINNKNAPIFASLNLLLNDSEDNEEVFFRGEEIKAKVDVGGFHSLLT